MRAKTEIYAASLIDSEGCISLQKHNRPKYPHYQLMVTVSTTSDTLAKWFVKYFGGTRKKLVFSDPQRRTQYSWCLYGNKSLHSFLLHILPYTVIKRAQNRVGLDFLNMNGEYDPERREVYFQEMKALKKTVSVETETPDPLGKEGRVYYAGLLDGEGSLNLVRNSRNGKYKRYVSVTNVYRPVLDALQTAYGGIVIPKKDGDRVQPCFVWFLSSKPAIEKLLLWSMPYLLIKRQEAKVLLSEVRLPNTRNRPLRDTIYAAFKSVQDHPRGKTQSKLPCERESDPAETPSIQNTFA